MAWDNRPANPLSEVHRRLRPLVLIRDGHQCQIRGSRCTGVATEVDHIKNRASAGADDLANYQAVCPTCHKRKTYGESYAARMKRRKDLKHSWTRLTAPGLIDD